MRKFWHCISSGLIADGLIMIWVIIQSYVVEYQRTHIFWGKVYGTSTNPDKLVRKYFALEPHAIEVGDIVIWLITAFLVGILFDTAGYIFKLRKWSLRKKAMINFLVCLAMWLLIWLFFNDYQISLDKIVQGLLVFILVYAISYGGYFWNLRYELNHFNRALKQNK